MCEPTIFDVIGKIKSPVLEKNIIFNIYRSVCLKFSTISFTSDDVGIQIALPPCTLGLRVKLLSNYQEDIDVTIFYSIFPCMPFENILYPQNGLVIVPFSDFGENIASKHNLYITVGFYTQL